MLIYNFIVHCFERFGLRFPKLATLDVRNQEDNSSVGRSKGQSSLTAIDLQDGQSSC